MPRAFKPWYYDKDRRRVRVADWYAEWQEGPRTRRKRVGSRADALAYAVDRERAYKRRAALGQPAAPPDAARPLTDLLNNYLAVLAAQDTGAYHRGEVRAFVLRTLAGCGWATWRDVRADDLRVYLGRRRDKDGNSPATLNTYLRRVKAFVSWVADRLEVLSPLRKVRAFPEAVDLRRGDRILTDKELAQLIAGAEAAPRRHGTKLTGADRAKLYLIAAYSGLRASELSRLTPESFDLRGSPPTVGVPARDAKGKRDEPVPLPHHVVAVLKPWLKKKVKGRRVFPGGWASGKNQGRWLAADLARGGVAELDAKGQRVTFHSLKRRFVVRVIESGAKVHELRRMARHKSATTTLKHYTRADMTDLGKLADRLPPPG